MVHRMRISRDRRYAIGDEAMHRKAADRLAAWVQAPQPSASTATVTPEQGQNEKLVTHTFAS